MTRGASTRALLAPFAALVLGLVWWACGGGEEQADEIDPVRLDERIARLLEPCVNGHFYDRDTSDMVPVMLEKLERGQSEPLKRAKEELGAGGQAAAEGLRRLFERHFATLQDAPYLENVLDAAALNPTLEAHDILVRALDHPLESVRQRALVGMIATHALPTDFDLFLARVDGVETGQLRRSLARALFVADAARAEKVVLGWLAADQHQDLWIEVCPRIAEGVGSETAELCRPLYAGLGPLFASWVAAPAARAGDAEALAFMRAGLEQEDPNRRMTAVRALTACGLPDELLGAALEDPDQNVRVLALEAVASAPEMTPERRAVVSAALDDPSPVVRAQALKHLCEREDAEGLGRALTQLTGGTAGLQEALSALRGPLLRDPALAERAFERLLERHAEESHRPLQQRTATYKALGIVPLAKAALFLRSIGLEQQGEVIESLRAHDWLMIQASNTGPAGRAALFDELASEDDPLRRIDIVAALGSARDDTAREHLLGLVEGAARSPYEILLAASRLVKLGPASINAPRLKRISYDIELLEARVGLQCLLWTWY